jgi:hypothetical protein
MAGEESEGRVGAVVDGRYKLVEVMASGAMGAVFKAERVPIGKLVAVKFLHAAFVNDGEFLARFERETRVMSKLSHPNCVSVLDFGVWEGAPYLVMDFVAGTTLRARMDDGPLPAAQALAFTRQIASGLAHAHEHGIVHRDIKPANMMISDEIGHGERVRILDFGLARLQGGGAGRDATQSHIVVGTPNYMAPEQTVPGSTIDARTDIYAVGVVLFEMFAGDHPFHADDTLNLLAMHRAAPIPRLADRVPEGSELPDGVQAIVDKAMAKAPDDRFQSAIELARALDALADRAPEAEVEVARRPVRAKSDTAAAVAPTMLDIESGIVAVRPRARARAWPTIVGAIVLIGGAAAMAAVLVQKSGDGDHDRVVAAPRDAGPPVAVAVAPAKAIDAAAQAAVVAAPAPAVAPDALAAADADVAPDVAVAAAAAAEPVADAAPAPAAPDAAAGSATAEIEMDPTTAEDPDPAAAGSGVAAADEAADAPKTSEEAEQHGTAAVPQLATNLPDAIELIKAGQRDRALASLLALRRKSPSSAYIPFLLGNLYNDQRWWSVAMDNYKDAIGKNAAYRKNPTLNRNVIRMLASGKTRAKAAGMLRGTVGRACVPFLKAAAAHDPHPVVRAQAAAMLHAI